MTKLATLQHRLGWLDQRIAECSNAITRFLAQKQFAAEATNTQHREARRVLDLKESYARAELREHAAERESVLEAIGFLTTPLVLMAPTLSPEARSAVRELIGHGVYNDDALNCDQKARCLTSRKKSSVDLRGQRQARKQYQLRLA